MEQTDEQRQCYWKIGYLWLTLWSIQVKFRISENSLCVNLETYYFLCFLFVFDMFMLNILTEQLRFFLLLGMELNIAAASASLYEV